MNLRVQLSPAKPDTAANPAGVGGAFDPADFHGESRFYLQNCIKNNLTARILAENPVH